jgi:adenylate cyclase
MSDLAAGGPAVKTEFRVLIVDDDPDMSAYLGHLLKQLGMKAETIDDGRTAIERVAAMRPDLVLLDVMMPGASGFEICQKLKTNEATALIPVVLVTALEDHESRVKGIDAGADDFLSKPIRREELRARVMTLRRLHETRKELEGRRLAAEVEKKNALRNAFARYISPHLADQVLRESSNGQGLFRDLSDRTSVVALFADLRGFTRLSETVAVSRIVPMLNEFFSVLTTAAHDNEGTIFSMAGDSLLVGFNVPMPQEDATERAVKTGRAMIRRFAPIAVRWKVETGLHFGIGVGIEAGEVVVGNVGAPSFMSYTIIGDAVNVAARLMQTAEIDEVLVGPRASEMMPTLATSPGAQALRRLTLRGKSEPIEVLSLRVRAA